MIEKYWCNIKNYEGYMVSNYGDIISFRKRNSKEFYSNPKILKQSVNVTHCGKKYKTIRLFGKILFVHRLVGEHFIENPLNKPQINHIDGNSENNIVTNLEWVTNSENQIHRFNLKGTKNNYGQYIHKNRNTFRVYKKNVTDKCFKTLQEAQQYAQKLY